MSFLQKMILHTIVFLFCFAYLQAVNQDSLEKAAINTSDKQKAEIYNTLSKSYQNLSSEKAINYAKLALISAQKVGDKKNEAQANFNIGFNLVSQNKIDESTKYFKNSLDIRTEIGDKLLVASSLNALGNVARLLGQSQQALDYYLQSLEIRKESGDKMLIASTYNNIGIVYKYWGNFEKAIDYYFESLKYAQSLNDSSLLITTNLNIGNLYSELKKYNKSLEHYFQVLNLAQRTNNLADVSAAYNSIGTIYNYLNQIDKALEYFKKSYQLAYETGNIATQCSALNNLGESYHRLKQYDLALKYYQMSADLSDESGDLFSKSTSLNNIGSVYRNKKQYKMALPYLMQSLEINTKHENLTTLKENYINLAAVYDGMGDYKKAYYYHCLYSELNDSLSSESINKKLVDMQIKLETDKKEKEINLLKREKDIEAGIKNYLYALLALGLILIIVVTVLFIFKLRANRILAEKNLMISNQKDQITKSLEELNIINVAKDKYLNIINEELARASDYVISLIPPAIPSGDIRTEWMLKSSSKLGGDTFGYHWIDENHFAVYLLDVSGHGVSGALHSIAILNTIKFETLTNTDFKVPEKVLSALNNVFQMREHNRLFFTIWYGVYNKATRELKYASAGHPPAVLITGEEQVEFLGTKNYVIGGTKKFDYASDAIILKPLSKLFIYSDGVYEIMDKAGNMWTIDELKTFIFKQSNNANDELENLYRFVVDYHKSDTLDDDFSIIKLTID